MPVGKREKFYSKRKALLKESKNQHQTNYYRIFKSLRGPVS